MAIKKAKAVEIAPAQPKQIVVADPVPTVETGGNVAPSAIGKAYQNIKPLVPVLRAMRLSEPMRSDLARLLDLLDGLGG